MTTLDAGRATRARDTAHARPPDLARAPAPRPGRRGGHPGPAPDRDELHGHRPGPAVPRPRAGLRPLPIPVGHRRDPARRGGRHVPDRLDASPLRPEAGLDHGTRDLHAREPGLCDHPELGVPGPGPVRPELGQRDGRGHRPGDPLARVPPPARRRDLPVRVRPLFRPHPRPELQRLPDPNFPSWRSIFLIEVPLECLRGRLHGEAPPARPARPGKATPVRRPRVRPAALLGRLPDAGALPVPEVGLADLQRVLARVGPRGPGADGLPGP